MSLEQIKKAYLKAVGNPESGVLAEMADEIAKAIEEELSPKEVKEFNPVKEQRVIKPTETR
jgi:hypothetical protein